MKNCTLYGRRPCYIKGYRPENVQISNRRIEVYKEALNKLKLTDKEAYVRHANFTRLDAREQTKTLIPQNDTPDAIIAYSDQMAISAVLEVKEASLTIPSDIGIMGFNNEPVDELMEPTLTSIDQPAFEMGQKAAKALFAQIKGGQPATVETLQSQLIVRKSTSKL